MACGEGIIRRAAGGECVNKVVVIVEGETDHGADGPLLQAFEARIKARIVDDERNTVLGDPTSHVFVELEARVASRAPLIGKGSARDYRVTRDAGQGYRTVAELQ